MLLFSRKENEIEKKFVHVVENGVEKVHCLLMISNTDPLSSQEQNRHYFNNSTEDMYLVDLPECKFRYRINNIVAEYPLSSIGFVRSVEKAPIIITTLFRFMETKTSPKDIIMPIRAAIDARAIRKPTKKEFEAIFVKFFGEGLIKSKSSLDDYCNQQNDPYSHIGEYNGMVETFREIMSQ